MKYHIVRQLEEEVPNFKIFTSEELKQRLFKYDF